ncbi:Putative pyrimidine permease RutG [Leclercia adecarboxylata]|uniref:Pyrimidine permease RutG n=1 Tax=Leclercia adecarboxylata TaxID=83655 RepID=A0A4U9HQ93_9ENTR|nr:Putative pyrimidine permease RutG [Leclercia adecarboxylata]
MVFGLIAVAGARIWVQNRVDLSQNGNLIMVAVTLVLGAGDFCSLPSAALPWAGSAPPPLARLALNALLSRRMAAVPQGEAVTQEP